VKLSYSIFPNLSYLPTTTLPLVPLTFTPSQTSRLLSNCSLVVIPSDSVIKPFGQEFSKLFIVKTGKVAIYTMVNGQRVRMKEVKREVIGDDKGSFLGGGEVEVVAEGEVEGVQVERDVFDKVMARRDMGVLETTMRDFEEYDIFKGIKKEFFQSLISEVRFKRFRKGELVVLKDTQPLYLMIVKSGELRSEVEIKIESKNIWPLNKNHWTLSKTLKSITLPSQTYLPSSLPHLSALINSTLSPSTLIASKSSFIYFLPFTHLLIFLTKSSLLPFLPIQPPTPLFEKLRSVLFGR
jgi:hypothetical protein